MAFNGRTLLLRLRLQHPESTIVDSPPLSGLSAILVFFSMCLFHLLLQSNSDENRFGSQQSLRGGCPVEELCVVAMASDTCCKDPWNIERLDRPGTRSPLADYVIRRSGAEDVYSVKRSAHMPLASNLGVLPHSRPDKLGNFMKVGYDYLRG